MTARRRAGRLELAAWPRSAPRRLCALRRLHAMGGARRRNPKPGPHFGTVLTGDEMERVQSLLEDGYALMLTPLADQVAIATVDLDKVMSLIGDPRANLH